MSSWTNKDLYVAYGFGTSNANGYYYPDTTENFWYNSSNSVSLIYTGIDWFLRNQDAVPAYYYGAVDSGSGICDDLIFASNSVYPFCTGTLPIGEVIYGGVEIESSSSSGGTTSSSSSSSSSGEEHTAMICLLQDFVNIGYYAMINLETCRLSHISQSRVLGDIALYNGNRMYGIYGGGGLYRVCDDGRTSLVDQDIWGWASVFSDTSYEVVPGLYTGAGHALTKHTPGTWEVIGNYAVSVYLNALVIHDNAMYMTANSSEGLAWQKKLFRIDFDPLTETAICDLPEYMAGLVSINGRLYAVTEFTNQIYLINVDTGVCTLKGTIVSPPGFGMGLANVPADFPYDYCSFDSSSSSSTSSESFVPPESSSSSESENALELFSILVNQGHHDIIPFSYIAERGQQNNTAVDNTTFGFSYTQTSSNLPYSVLLNFNTISATTTSTFVPETEDAKYKHEPIFYVDIIAEGHGVNEYALRSQIDMYVKEKPTTVFNIPKFSWNDSIFGYSNANSSSSVDVKEGYVWIGTTDKFVKKVYYSMDSASLVEAYNAPSEVYTITFGQKDNDAFVSCYDHLVIYTATSYYSGNDDFHEEYKILNDNDDLMVLDDLQSGYLISCESYQGNVIFRDRSTLNVVATYDGFDAPFKVLWSKAHNCYLVAGTHTLWKLSNGVKTAVYNIKDYSIVDFDCSEDGVVGIIFKGSDYIIRFLAKNLYTMLYTETVTDKNVRYCKYCEQGKFYVLQEITSGDAYSTVSYLFDSTAKTLAKTESTNSIATTTTTTTPHIPSSKIEIIEPVSTTVWQKGSSCNIKWLSNASLTDLVKIELYNGISVIDTLAEQTGNTGIFVWNIAETYENGNNYKVKITWLAAGDTSQFDESDVFALTDIPQTTTTTTTKILDTAIGVEYNKYTEQIIVVLGSGLIGVYDLSDHSFKGMFDSGVQNAYCTAFKDQIVRQFKGVNKVRVYVGSEPHLSDLWDSGIIETELTSMYYGGKMLNSGECYYVNVQVFSESRGWSEIQSKKFIMPR